MECSLGLLSARAVAVPRVKWSLVQAGDFFWPGCSSWDSAAKESRDSAESLADGDATGGLLVSPASELKESTEELSAPRS